VSDQIDYLSAIEEGEFAIAQANARLTAKGEMSDELVSCRLQNEFTLVRASAFKLHGCESQAESFSVAASLIPLPRA